MRMLGMIRGIAAAGSRSVIDGGFAVLVVVVGDEGGGADGTDELDGKRGHDRLARRARAARWRCLACVCRRRRTTLEDRRALADLFGAVGADSTRRDEGDDECSALTFDSPLGP